MTEVHEVDMTPRRLPARRKAKPIRTRVVVAALVAVALSLVAATIAVTHATDTDDDDVAAADEVVTGATPGPSTTVVAAGQEVPAEAEAAPIGEAAAAAPDGAAPVPAAAGATPGAPVAAAAPTGGALLPAPAAGGGSTAGAPSGAGPTTAPPVATTAPPAPTTAPAAVGFPAAEGCDTGGWDLAVCRVGDHLRLVTSAAAAPSCQAVSATTVRCGPADGSSTLWAEVAGDGLQVSYAPAAQACRPSADRFVCQVLAGTGERDPWPAVGFLETWATGPSTLDGTAPEGCRVASPFTCGGVTVAVDRSVVRVELTNQAGVGCGAARAANGKVTVRCGEA